MFPLWGRDPVEKCMLTATPSFLFFCPFTAAANVREEGNEMGEQRRRRWFSPFGESVVNLTFLELVSLLSFLPPFELRKKRRRRCSLGKPEEESDGCIALLLAEGFTEMKSRKYILFSSLLCGVPRIIPECLARACFS